LSHLQVGSDKYRNKTRTYIATCSGRKDLAAPLDIVAMAAKIDQDAFERRFRDYIYIPAGLLVVGTMIVKIEWTPYAALLAVVLGTWNYFAFRE
jgi:hypothetical protein